ncbi:protein Mss51p, mitochondrial [[Candida] railenensis]|uniref:Protein Mss51p, mitochondrial n=1 Tax=[Candida] railenensis TaxID=45579 RepID=A0A9P0QMP7_9ASCO|nr:protein Mss51p, mitochondrial [[Candida] railenensis]
MVLVKGAVFTGRITKSVPLSLSVRHFSLLKGALSLLALNKTESDSTSANGGAGEHQLIPWDESPYEDLRTRAAFIRTKARCPTTGKSVNYVCPISGIPTHHDEAAWAGDVHYHDTKTYDLLKKVNLYEHDLRSGRKFDEFVFPGQQEKDCIPNMSNWDAFFYTRDFSPMNTEFNLAAASKVLTYPVTVASVFHRFSPYQQQTKKHAAGEALTLEGLKSLAALRYTLYPPYSKQDESSSIFKDRPMRIFIVGSKMESMLPGYVWKQFGYLFPETKFEFHFIGPECYFDPKTRSFGSTDQPHGRALVERFDEQITLHYHTQYFHELYEMGDLFPFDPYLDAFFLFHPGFATADEIHWNESLKGLLDSKCPIYITGYHEKDATREFDWLKKHPLSEEMDILMNLTENFFGSTKLDLVDINPTETFQANHNIFAVRGKRYHAIKK